MRRLLPALLLLVPLTLRAEPPPAMEPLPDVPAPPPSGVGDQGELEPEVSIIKRDEATIYEYRINGQLYMVKVEPRVGYPYYLVDADGDGSLESRYNKLEPNLVVPRWMIYRW